MSDYPEKYEQLNDQSTKRLNVVIEVEGLSTYFSTVTTYKKIRFGDPDLFYGDGAVYGGLRALSNVKAYLSLNSSLVIQQRIEPEQGRGAAGTFNLEFIDFNGEMTRLASPGQDLDEPLGSKLVKIYIGHQLSSFKEDYFVIFRGYISSITCAPTKVIWQLTDANVKRRQQCFYLGKSTVSQPIKTFLFSDVDAGANLINLISHGYTKDMKVKFGSSNTLPSGIEFDTEYFIVNTTTHTFQISSYYDGDPIDITSQGVGTHQVQLSKIVGEQLRSFTATEVNNVNNKIYIKSHGYRNNMLLEFTTSGRLPSPIQVGSVYYAIVLNADEISLSSTLSGPAIDLIDSGAGESICKISGAPQATIKIPMLKTDGFINHVLGPLATYDSSLRTYLKISDEFLEYLPGAIASDGITVTRASRDTIALELDGNADIANYIELQGYPIDLALKIMLSGWGGPNQTNIAIDAFQETGVSGIGSLPKAIILPDNVDAVSDYGLSSGDYITVTGSLYNNGTYTVNSFDDLNYYPNKIIYVNESLLDETSTAGVMSIRSQYDTLPSLLSVKLKNYDVDIARWQLVHNDFLFQSDNIVSILIDSTETAKEFIEKELMLPFGGYTISRFGRLSCTITKPPIVDDRLTVLDKTNIIEPQNITVNRSLNQRRFFNEVQYFYDTNDAGEFTNRLNRLDVDSLSKTTVSSVLPIKSRGIKTTLGASTLIARRGDYILKRYKDGAIEISLKVNFKAASLIEVGDVVPLYDNGDLKISNLVTGERDLGSQLFEVIDRSIDIKTGTASLKLLTQLGYQIDDRFATISPSSLVDVGSTVDSIRFKDSFGVLYPNNEKRKWEPFIGENIIIRSADYSVMYTRSLSGFNPGNPYEMQITPSLPSPPPEGYIIDIDDYPNTINSGENQKYKLMFCFINPTVPVVSGTSGLEFDVSLSDAALFTVGLPVIVRPDNWSNEVIESKVDSIVGTTITLITDVGFTPSAGDKVDLIGFIDGGGPYRYL